MRATIASFTAPFTVAFVVACTAPVLLVPAPARACDRLPIPIGTFTAFPADGAIDVATDARPIVPVFRDATFNERRPRLLQGPDFTDVAVDIDRLAVRGEFGRLERMWRLTPRATLEPLTLYRLVDDAAADANSPAADANTRIAEFTTGDGTTGAPTLSAPVVAVTGTAGAQRDTTGFFCAFDGTATLVVTPALDNDGVPLLAVAGIGQAPDLDAATSDNDAAFDPDAPAVDGLGAPDVLIFGDGPLEVEVAMMDVAGRLSPTTTVAVDLSEAGCAQAPTGTGLAGLAGLALLRRRRRG